MPPPQPLDLAEVLAKLATVLNKPRSSHSLEEEFGADRVGEQRKRSTSRFAVAADQEVEGSSVRVFIEAHATGALDEGRVGGFERQHAMFCQMYGVLESAATDSGHNSTWAWRWHGLSGPRRSTRRHERAPFRRRDNLQEQIRAVAKQTLQAKQQGQGGKGAKAKDGGGKLRPGRDLMMLAQLVLATVQGSPRDIKVGGPCFFCTGVLSFQRNRVYEICQRGDRDSSFPSHFEAASDPDASQPAPSCAL